jgi:hypothetical protein
LVNTPTPGVKGLTATKAAGAMLRFTQPVVAVGVDAEAVLSIFNIFVMVSAQIFCLSARIFCVAAFVEVVCNVYCMGAMQA